MDALNATLNRLKGESYSWLVTGAAGFIGSHLLQTLLRENQRVIGLDNFATGTKANIEEALESCTPAQRACFHFIEGDIRNAETCKYACRKADLVLHQAALGSVPRSIEDPISSHETNVTGFLNMLVAARDAAVKRFVYASSSSIYGDDPELPKVEGKIGRPLSPYAVTKATDELYAAVFWKNYGLQTIGLRYFNVFGPRQNPNGPYAAVIPCWILAMIRNQPAFINGTGTASRDFCYVTNVVQANLLAALTPNPHATGENFNVALNERTTLAELWEIIRCRLLPQHPHLKTIRPTYRASRSGDIAHSLADIRKAQSLLGYTPTQNVEQGLDITVQWFAEKY